MNPLTIGQVAQHAEVGIETIRFYEREGMLEKPDRSAAGYRLYGQEVIDRLQFIRGAKELGFTLKETRELLELHVDPTATCTDMKRRAKKKVSDIEEKIRTLQRMKRELVKLTKDCSNKAPTSECPILEAIKTNRKDG